MGYELPVSCDLRRDALIVIADENDRAGQTMESSSALARFQHEGAGYASRRSHNVRNSWPRCSGPVAVAPDGYNYSADKSENQSNPEESGNDPPVSSTSPGFLEQKLGCIDV
jgi:hypothetical protein